MQVTKPEQNVSGMGEALNSASMEALLKIQQLVFEFRDAVYRIIAEGEKQD